MGPWEITRYKKTRAPKPEKVSRSLRSSTSTPGPLERFDFFRGYLLELQMNPSILMLIPVALLGLNGVAFGQNEKAL